MVRTAPFQGVNPGSIPGRVTTCYDSDVYTLNEEKEGAVVETEGLSNKPPEKRRHRALVKLRELIQKAKRDPLIYPKTSELLASIAHGPADDRITVGELVAALDRRACVVVILRCGLLSCMPLPPGIASLVGVPIFLLGGQLIRGKHKPWLPAIIRRRTFRRGDLAKYVLVRNDWIRYIESFFRPRLLTLTWLLSPYVVGAVVMLTALYIIVPVPFLGFLPAVALVLLAVALVENDGLLLVIGLAGAIAAMAVSTFFAAGTISFAFATIGRLLGL